MAIPHPSSVIDPFIDTFDSAFYQKLIEMENYTYADPNRKVTDGVTAYTPFWQAYSDAIINYLNQSIVKQELQEYIVALYTFLVQFEVNGNGSQAKKDESDAQLIFNINNLIPSVLNYPVDYYDDYEEEYTDDSGNVVPATAPHLEQDTTVVNSAWTPDRAIIDQLKAYYIQIGVDSSINAVFDNMPESQGEFDAQIAWDIVFIDLHWKSIIEIFGFDFTIPPRPDKPPQPPSS